MSVRSSTQLNNLYVLMGSSPLLRNIDGFHIVMEIVEFSKPYILYLKMKSQRRRIKIKHLSSQKELSRGGKP